MFEKRQLDQAFQDAAVLPLSASSRYALFSDCHRGNGLTGDNFLKNQHLYAAALRYYYENDFTYIELGDGDELWENRSFSSIKEAHASTFQMLARFCEDQRLYLLYGNHDMSKRSAAFSSQCDTFHPCITCREEPLFPDIRFHPGLILRNQETGPDLYLTHGHQADFLNSVLWRQARFLVRYLWSPLERVGFLDPSDPSRKNKKKERIEKSLSGWARANQCILVAGHTHRPVLEASSCYYNTGSCVRPGYITCIEISQLTATLIKWTIGIRTDLSLSVSREILAGPVSLKDCGCFPGAPATAPMQKDL